MSDRLSQLLKLHDADPADPFCTYGIALEHSKAGRLDDALAWLEKTLEADSGYCYAYFQKGKILDQAGRTEEGRAVLKGGIEKARKVGTPDAMHAAEEMGTLLESMD